MLIVNERQKLPRFIVAAVARQMRAYERRDGKWKVPPREDHESRVGITTLIRPMQMIRYEIDHWDEIVVDVVDLVWLFDGTFSHFVIEAAELDDTLQEEKLVAQVTTDLGMINVVAKLDIWEQPHHLWDVKRTSVWRFVNGDTSEWTQQLNSYAAIMRTIGGFPVERIGIVALLKDWKWDRAQQSEDYPRDAIITREFEVWPHQKSVEFIRSRVLNYQKMLRGEFNECSESDRWYRGEKWALKKAGNQKANWLFDSAVLAEQCAADKERQEGGKWAVHKLDSDRALKVFDDLQKAESYAEAYRTTKLAKTEIVFRPGIKYEIEHRPGENVRCNRGYCRVSSLCPQWKTILHGLSIVSTTKGD